MDTVQPIARVAGAQAPSVCSNSDDASGAVEGWEGDIVRASRAAVRRLGLRGDHPIADDVAQDVRLALLLAVRRTGIKDERYVRRLISNSARNSARQSKVAALEVPDDNLPVRLEAPSVCDVLAERAVQRWIGEQKDLLQAVFRLLYCAGLTQRQAAERLGVSQPRVATLHRQLLERGKQQLRDLAA